MLPACGQRALHAKDCRHFVDCRYNWQSRKVISAVPSQQCRRTTNTGHSWHTPCHSKITDWVVHVGQRPSPLRRTFIYAVRRQSKFFDRAKHRNCSTKFTQLLRSYTINKRLQRRAHYFCVLRYSIFPLECVTLILPGGNHHRQKT